MATQFATETTDGPPCFFGGMGSLKNRNKLNSPMATENIPRLKYSYAFLLRNRD